MVLQGLRLPMNIRGKFYNLLEIESECDNIEYAY